ncbi:ABC transporter ATP-binding protein [Herpetosiphon giganteus]|uniref:ABC transporter ATP-binding protein n=1 Tax=Herpetosiphon giganteus TaxID=2029754 RepID=UPI00195E3DF4|nr:ABC transporter ATP-binding protein [Herpetosiphon giganteus]MBM7843365.1 ABC-2 type transport system ATP-binding protein [Herpetosiphon giganteus]
MTAIQVENLVKIYGPLRAVDGISFDVANGEVFGMLGPNGAGKSTTTEMIEGLRKPDGGSIHVLGHDVVKNVEPIKQRIGIQLQTTSLFQKLTTRELVKLFASFYKNTLPIDEVIGLVNLEEKVNTPSKALSGGQRQRLAVAIALINDPDIIFLDEPTTGLDPQARRSMWDVVSNLQKRGKTVFLTTHYMEEAERLCDRVAVVDHGKIIALGKPQALIHDNFDETALEFSNDEQLPESLLANLPGVERVQNENGITTIYSKGVARTTNALMALVERQQTELRGFTIRAATLEDVFLKLTGRRIRD